MEVFWLVVVGVLGLVAGSFIGAYSWRYPRNISIARGRSFCPKCRRQIVWYDNIPVVSYILLKGRCRNCKRHIALRYPAIELATLGVFIVVFLFLPRDVSLPLYLFWAGLMVALVVIDLEHRLIPDAIVFPGFISVLVLLLLTGSSVYAPLVAGFASALFLLLVYLATRGRGMGLGDVKLALFAGTTLGLGGSLVWLFGSFVMGAVVGIGLILLGKTKFGSEIAFGPFLAVSWFIVVLTPVEELFFKVFLQV